MVVGNRRLVADPHAMRGEARGEEDGTVRRTVTAMTMGIALGLALLAPLMLGPQTRPGGSSRPFTGVTASPPVVDERSGAVFVGTQRFVNGRTVGGGVVQVFDSQTGTLLHRVRLRDHYPATLAVDNALGRLVLATAGCEPAGGGFGCASEPAALAVLDARTGIVLHRLAVSPPAPPAPSRYASGGLAVDERTRRAFLSRPGSVVSLSLTGRFVATVASVPGYAYAPIIDGSIGRVVVSSSAYDPNTERISSGLSGLDAATGQVLYRVTSHGSQRNNTVFQVLGPAAADTRRHRALAIGANPGMGAPPVATIYTLDVRRGTVSGPVLLEPRNPDAWPGLPLADERTGHTFIGVVTSSSTVGQDDVYALDTTAGHVLGHTPVAPGLPYLGPPLLGDDPMAGRVIAVTLAEAGRPGHLTLLDAQSRAVLRTETLTITPGVLSVASQSGRVFIFSQDDSAVQVLDSATGAPVARVTLGTPLARGLSSLTATIDARTGRVFVVHHLDTLLSVLDARTGRVLRTTPL